MTSHIAVNDVVASIQPCPGIPIHVIDIVQPPGICISGMPDMDVHQMIVKAAVVAKSEAQIAKKARWAVRSESGAASIVQIRDSKLVAREIVWGMMY